MSSHDSNVSNLFGHLPQNGIPELHKVLAKLILSVISKPSPVNGAFERSRQASSLSFRDYQKRHTLLVHLALGSPLRS